jgi:hypothetical protein
MVVPNTKYIFRQGFQNFVNDLLLPEETMLLFIVRHIPVVILRV